MTSPRYFSPRTNPDHTGSLSEISLAYSGVRSHRLEARAVCLSVWRSHYSETHSLSLAYAACVHACTRTYVTYKAESARFKRVTNRHSLESRRVYPASLRMKCDEMQIGKKTGKIIVHRVALYQRAHERPKLRREKRDGRHRRCLILFHREKFTYKYHRKIILHKYNCAEFNFYFFY